MALIRPLVPVPVAADAAGVVSGVNIDGLAVQPGRGSRVRVEGAGVELSSDIGGSFRADVPAATRSVMVTGDGLEPQRIKGVMLAEGRSPTSRWGC